MVLSVILTSHEAVAQEDTFDKVVKAMSDGNSKSLAAYFNTIVELVLPDHENTYSASQAEMIMRDFFKKYPPNSCAIVQKGTTGSTSSFAICDYTSGRLLFQLYIHLQQEKGKFLIRKIKFDEKK